MQKLTKETVLHTVKDYTLITVGAFFVAISVYFFMLPSNLAVGSASALAMICCTFIPMPVSLLNLIFNIFFLVIGFILIGTEFGIKTVYASVILPLFVGLFEIVFPDFKSITGDALLDALCYILIVAIGMAILFSANASSGGLDIIAKIMNKYLHIELGRAFAISGLAVAFCSIFVYDAKTVVLSVLATYFGGMVVDHFIFGLNIKRRVCVISPKLDEIVDFILHDLHSGATLNEIIGAYDNTPRTEVIVIVDKNEYIKLMDFVKKVDPKAFVTVYSVNEIRYQPKMKK